MVMTAEELHCRGCNSSGAGALSSLQCMHSCDSTKRERLCRQRHCKGIGHGSRGSVRVTSVTTRQANKHRRKGDARMDIKEMVAGEKDEKMRQHSQKEVTL